MTEFILETNGDRLSRPRCEEVYEFEEIVGSGTFSDVVRGVHNVSGERVAIKIIDKVKFETDRQRWRIRNEIELHRSCEHPHIAKFVDFFESDTDICLIMELCEGGELWNRISEKKYFSEKEASRIIKQIVTAIKYLHDKGIVHRDIKPENLLFTTKGDEGIIKVCDFGLAKRIDHVSGRALLKASTSGTVAYCAPERLSQDKETKAVDIWSVGCIMYFLLFGCPPFYSNKEDEQENDDEIYEAVMEGCVSFEGKRPISDYAQDLILRLLEKDPTKRLPAEHILSHPWIQLNSSLSDIGLEQGDNEIGNPDFSLKASMNRVIDVCSNMQQDAQ